MPVLLVNAALTSSSAFFIEAAAKTVMALSCATAEERGLASPMPSAAAARNLRVRSSILALLEAAAAPARCRAALRHVVRPQVCQEATNPEAPFRGSGALTARHGPRRNPSSIAGEGKGGARYHCAPRDTVRSSPRGAPRDSKSAFTRVCDALCVAGTPLRGPSLWLWIPSTSAFTRVFRRAMRGNEWRSSVRCPQLVYPARARHKLRMLHPLRETTRCLNQLVP